MQRVPTASSDRACSRCPTNQFQSKFNGAQCQAFGICGAGSFVVSEPSPEQDRVCGPCDGITSYQDQVNQLSCKAIVSCDSSEFQSSEPTASSDRVCKTVTRCGSGFFQVDAPTLTSDRVCEKWSACDEGYTQEIAPTSTSDRVCGILYVVGFSLDYATVEAQRDIFVSAFIEAMVNVSTSATNIYLRPGSVLADVFVQDFGSRDNLKSQVEDGLSFSFQGRKVKAQDVNQPSKSKSSG